MYSCFRAGCRMDNWHEVGLILVLAVSRSELEVVLTLLTLQQLLTQPQSSNYTFAVASPLYIPSSEPKHTLTNMYFVAIRFHSNASYLINLMEKLGQKSTFIHVFLLPYSIYRTNYFIQLETLIWQLVDLYTHIRHILYTYKASLYTYLYKGS